MADTLNPLSFPLWGSRLIEASAGTGKTYTIAALYVRLVLQHGEDNAFSRALLPTEILVLTFTEAATAELKDRIRARLADAALVFRGQNEGDAFLQQLLADYPEQKQRAEAAEKLDLAAQWMDEAAVSTIHGWCYRMLREHAFDSNSLFDMALMTDSSELLQQVAEDYWRCFFYPLSASSLEAIGLPASPAELLSAVRPLLSVADIECLFDGKPLPVPDNLPDDQQIQAFVQQQQQQQAEIRQRFAAQWEAVGKNLYAMYPHLNMTGYKPFNTPALFDAFVQALENWCKYQAEEPAHLARFQADYIDGKRKKSWPADLVIHPLFTALQQFMTERQQRLLSVQQLYRHAACWMEQRRARFMQQQASVSFDDMLNRLHQALKHEQGNRLAARIARQFPVVMVDEFQDTDPVQYAIFDRIYPVAENSPQTGMFLIGDPKQAIYSFRGADIFTYLEARRATEGRHYSLDTNYRSTSELVNACNHIFSYAEQYEQGAFRYRQGDDNPLPFEPVKAQGKSAQFVQDGQPVAALRCWWHGAEDGEKSLSTAQYRQQMAEACASEIVRLLAGEQTGFRGDSSFRPLQAGNIAILVRTGKEASAIRSALEARQLRSVYLSDKESVFSQPQTLDVLSLLQAVAEPYNEQAIRRVLACASLDLPYADIARFDEDENHHEAVLADVHSWRDIWRQRGVLPMIRQFMQDYRLAERLAQYRDGERAMTNWLHLAEWLQQQSANAESEKALIRLLQQQIEQGGSEEHLLRLESDDDLIKVVTIHKSKGLQYPLVFLPFIASFRAVSKDDKYYIYQRHDQRVMELNSSNDDALQARDNERLNEDIRLLYVALTRAEYVCYLGIAPIARQAKWQPQLHKSALGYVLMGNTSGDDAATIKTRLDRLVAKSGIMVEAMPDISNQRYRPQQSHDVAEARRYQGQPPEHWWVASYSALQHSEAVVPDNAQSDKLLEELLVSEVFSPAERQADMHHFPRGAQAGVFLHSILEWAGEHGFAIGQQQPAALAQYLEAQCRSHQWQEWQPVISDWLHHFLHSRFTLLQQHVCLTELTQYQVEMEFWLSVSQADTAALDTLVQSFVLPGQPRPALHALQLNGMLKGFIDLVFEHNGRYYIGDYKSNWLGPDADSYNEQTMAQVVLEKRYDVQLALYLLALHRLLKARLPDYDYRQHMGGAVYWFLRGSAAVSQGVFACLPAAELVEQLDALFSTEVV